ncbi:serine/threonine protein kinase [Zavarzinella formosa]|uniref:serine/threonine protein kinase n=1 Tax=Zavarzinella formosa TaxID=360055 RepID=UPI00031B3977|nr:serine/threonine-protein kinase [Zavarzinella formosa]
MPAPTTVEEFVELIRKSAVLDDSRVSAYIQKLRESGDGSKDLNSIAGLFVRDGLLTYFQAEQFLQGRWKRFNIGKYKVLERLGSGGMGQVFLCEHKLMRRRVAVKVLPTAKATDPSSLERFYREARAVAALDHQNIVRAYDIDQDDNLHFLVMEYVDGASLHDIIRKTGPMDPTRAAHYIYWSAIGLHNAHENGLIHRDIKPANILVDRQGVVKILDLGLARFFNDDQDMLTKKYDENVLGTADYLAPEQAIDSHSVDGRADIYSLGATFYYMMTGQPPFAEGSVAQKLLWHQTRSPKPVTEYRKDMAPELVRVLEKMMAKKPDDRYESPMALADALLPFTQTPIGPPPDEEMPTLSAAAMNGVGGSSTVTASSRTMVTSAPRTPATGTGSDRLRASTASIGGSGSGSNGSAVADADTQKSAKKPPPLPVIEPVPDSVPGTPVWESIGAETEDSIKGEAAQITKKDRSGKKIDKPAPSGRSKPPVKPKSSTKLRKPPPKLPIPLIAGGGVILLAAAIILFFVFRGGSTKPTTVATGPDGGPRKIVLTKSPNGMPLHYTSLKEASTHLIKGDQIVIADDEWEELGELNRAANVTLSSAEGKRVVWKAPAAAKPAQNALLGIHNCDGVRISGITFQGGNRVEYGLRITGRCVGGMIEDVECSDATTANVFFRDCIADANRPFMLKGCRFTESGGGVGKSAIWFDSTPTQAKAASAIRPANREITVRDCQFGGPYAEAAIIFDGSMVGVSLNNNRIWGAADGILFHKLRDEVEVQATIKNNTFYGLKNAGIRIADTATIRKPANKINVEYNFFANSGRVVFADGDPNNLAFFVRKPNSNFRKKGMDPGFVQLFETAEIEVDLPADPAKKPFLTYDKNNPLAKAGDGNPVGAYGVD